MRSRMPSSSAIRRDRRLGEIASWRYQPARHRRLLPRRANCLGVCPPSSALKAAVAFYGHLVDPQNPVWPKSPMQLAPEMKAPVLGLYGGADTGIAAAQVEG